MFTQLSCCPGSVSEKSYALTLHTCLFNKDPTQVKGEILSLIRDHIE